jgi:CRISPR/Cas system-associated endonuclease Cas3-HD
MNDKIRAFVVEKTNDLLKAPSACKEVKGAAEAWLKAKGTAAEAEVTKKYIKEMEEDITSIDGLIGFVSSEMGIKEFGADTAKKMLAQAQKVKKAGGKYCFCPACVACEAMLAKKAEMLK